MRPIDRGIPQTYPSNWAALTQKQRDHLTFHHGVVIRGYIARAQYAISKLTSQLAASAPAVVGGTRKRRRSVAATTPNKKAKITVTPWGAIDQLHAEFVALNNEYIRIEQAGPANLDDDCVALRTRLQNFVAKVKETVKSLKDSSYGKSRRDLVTRLGQYCSYCELPIATSLAVEHMLPKSDFPLRSLAWSNFLLSCAMCNSFKSDKPPRLLASQLIMEGAPESKIVEKVLDAYFWPSEENYNNFLDEFQYTLQKVAYNDDGTLVRAEPIDNSAIASWIFSGAIKFIEDSGTGVTVSVNEELEEVLAADCGGANTTILTPALHAILQKYRLTLDINSPDITFAVKSPRLIEIIEKRVFTLDLSKLRDNNYLYSLQEGRRVLAEFSKDKPLFSSKEIRESARRVRMQILSGNVPDEVLQKLAEPQYAVQAGADFIQVEADRKETIITVKKRFHLLLDLDQSIFSLRRGQQFDVELRIVPVGSHRLVKKALIDDLKLNIVEAAKYGNKLTDRRMIKRTRAFVTALETISRWGLAVGNKAQEDAMRAAIAETVLATGFWTVWWWTYSRFIAVPPDREPLQADLLDTLRFVGTQSPVGAV
ncbi:HNH endonuclease [Stigmatella sp. ncwal1]|uniref:HNH endonuclease n=1 Tax=Stigmatella ashevillensis TaxID=2995309 RepID=A0ABT5D6Q4_9BACT|nr:HNH endonuclease [Stigmatella ashevillena]MDC0708744.1 HNH endonuclease [Stigmatella ashevillena]